MSGFKIEDWDSGYADEETVDPLESPCVENKNLTFYPGKMRMRYFNNNLLTGLTALKTFGEFRMFGASDAIQRLLLVLDGTTITRYDYSSGYSSSGSHTSGDVGAYTSGDLAYFTFIKNAIRIGFWSGWKDTWARSLWYGYINARKFFNNAQTFTGWYLEKSYLARKNSGVTLTVTDGASIATMTGGYSVGLTYEFDGYQENWIKPIENTGTSPTTTLTTLTDFDPVDLSSGGPVNINIALDYSDLNKRITAVNVYCAFNPDTSVAPYDEPFSPYYHIARVDINDSGWANTAGDVYDTDIELHSADPQNFPASYYVSGHENAYERGEIVEELYTRHNMVVGSQVSLYNLMVSDYAQSAYINERHFITRPQIPNDGSSQKYLPPWDERQVVLFSQLKKPDIFHWDVDYIDLTTPHGDSVTGIEELYGDLIIFKEYSMFRVSFNNSGNELNWNISEHHYDIGAVAMNSVAKGLDANGNSCIYFASSDNIYRISNSVVPITKYKNRIDYVTNYYGNVSDSEKDMYGVFNTLEKKYILSFTSDKALAYDVDTDSWWDWEWGTYAPEYLAVGVDNKVLGAEDDRVIEVVSSSSATAVEATQDVYWKTGWLSLDGEKYRDKRTRYCKLMYVANDTFTLKVYVNFSGTATHTETVPASASLGKYEFECSTLGQVYRLEITGTGLTSFAVHDFEIVPEPNKER